MLWRHHIDQHRTGINTAQPKDVDVPTGEIRPEPEARQEGPTQETISDGSDPPENQNSINEMTMSQVIRKKLIPLKGLPTGTHEGFITLHIGTCKLT